MSIKDMLKLAASKQSLPTEGMFGGKIPKATAPLNKIVLHGMQVGLSSPSVHVPEEINIPKVISFVKCALYLDEIEVENVWQLDEDTIVWERVTEKGKTENGLLRFHRWRLSCQGHIMVDDANRKTDKGKVVHVQARVMENTYNCYVINPSSGSGTNPTQERQNFGKLIMGIDDHNDVIGKIQILPEMDKPDDLNNSVQFYTDSHNPMHVRVDIPYTLQQYLGYVKLNATFNWDFSSFEGQAVPYDSSKPHNMGDARDWVGQLESPKSDSIMTRLFEEKYDRSLKCVPDIHSMSPGISALAELADDHLTMQDLFTLDPPDPATMHKTTIDMLVQAMKSDMDDDLRSNLLGVVKPRLDPDLQRIADGHKKFLGSDFALSYLLEGLSENKALEKHFDEDDKNKLLYFWNGNETGCLATNPNYSKVNEEIARLAFLTLVPRLKKYMDDDGEKWAKDLYEKLMTKSVFTTLLVQAATAEGRAIINKQTMVLYCLCPGKDYYSKFHEKIMIGKLQSILQYFRLSKEGREDVNDFVSDVIRQLIIMVDNKSDKLSQDMRRELDKQIREAMEELRVKTLVELTSKIVKLATEVIHLMVVMKGNVWQNMVKAVRNKIGNRAFRSLRLLGTMVYIGLFASSVYLTINSFLNWKNLTPDLKAACVIESITLTVKAISATTEFFVRLFEGCKSGKLSLSFMTDLLTLSFEDAVAEGIQNLIEKNMQGGEGMSEEVAWKVTQEINSELDRVERFQKFQKYFDVVDSIIKVLDVVSLAACVVVLGFQVSRDFKDGAPIYTKIFDIIQLACTSIEFTCAAIGLAVECTLVTIIGTVCCIVGLVLACITIIISLFEKPKPKPTPAEIFVTGKGKTFLNSLPKPSQKWLDDYWKRKQDADKE